MDLLTALESIKRVTTRFNKEEIACIRKHREDAIPGLLERVKYVAESCNDVSDDYCAHHYAMYLLAEFRVKEAFQYLVKFLDIDMEKLDLLIGYGLTEDFGAILASCADAADVPALKEVAADRTRNEFIRHAAVIALTVLWAEGVYDKNEFVLFLGNLIKPSEADGEDELTFRTFVVCDCKRIYFQELFDDIRDLFRHGLIDESIINLSNFENAVAGLSADIAAEAYKEDRRHRFVDDVAEYMEWWHIFREKPDFGRKIGRNEPCPCGSEKKYKHCCLR
jgi:hypothetical protein